MSTNTIFLVVAPMPAVGKWDIVTVPFTTRQVAEAFAQLKNPYSYYVIEVALNDPDDYASKIRKLEWAIIRSGRPDYGHASPSLGKNVDAARTRNEQADICRRLISGELVVGGPTVPHAEPKDEAGMDDVA